MPALYLTAAILFEVIGTIALKHSALTGSAWYGAITVASYILAFILLWASLKTIPLGIAYAAWAGVGIALTAVAGVVLFKERMDLAGLAGLAGISLIVIGILLLSFVSSMSSH